MSCNLFFKISALTCLGLVFILTAEVTRGARIEEEARVKTAYIYNFCKYVTWPDSGSDNSIDICLLGQGPLAEHLPTLEDKKIQDHKIVVHLYSLSSEANGCEVLFISESEKKELKNILGSLTGKPVLTVSDIEGFAHQGGMIELVRIGNKIRFVINKNSVDKAGLTMSSRLLKLATIVKGISDL